MENIDIIIVGIFLFITLIFGMLKGQGVKNYRDFTLGGRNFSTVILVMTICATLIGGGSTISIAAEVYKYGLIVLLATLGQPLSNLIVAYIFVPKFERFRHCTTIGDILEEMYGKVAKVFAGLCGSIMSVGFTAAQVKALSFVIGYLIDVPTAISVIISFLIIIFYSAFGGVRAVVMTDALQFIAFTSSIPMVLYVAMTQLGGWGNIIHKLPEEFLDVTPSNPHFFRYLILLVFYIIPFFAPDIVQRILMASSTEQSKRSFLFTAAFDVPFFIIAGMIGIVGYILAPTGISPNEVFLYCIDNVLPVGLKGLAIAGILAVIMSTADSTLNIATISLYNDFLKPMSQGNFSDQQELRFLRLITLLLGAISLIIALYFQNIFDIVLFAHNFWSPVIIFPAIAGLLGYRANTLSFIGGAVTGLVCWYLWQYQIVTEIDAVIPCLIANAIGFTIVRQLTYKPTANAK